MDAKVVNMRFAFWGYREREDRERRDHATQKWNLDADARGRVVSRGEEVLGHGGQLCVQYSQGTRQKEKKRTRE